MTEMPHSNGVNATLIIR